MADQVEVSIPKTVWNEKSNFTATAYFRTRSSAAADTPTTVEYRIDCLTTGKQIRGWTSVSAASSVSITIAPGDNAIQQTNATFRNGVPYERKQLTVSADRGLSTEANGTADWRVNNIHGVS